ncbi:MAG TPA: hypothetical protein VJ761_08690 [Ktedonobacteraceae bacterium]|nr:hypothetical protein [Ktedonobacteraceae bacterium]
MTDIQIFRDDCMNILPTLEASCVDLIVTSPPYADQRKDTYGGVHPDKYYELHEIYDRHREISVLAYSPE